MAESLGSAVLELTTDNSGLDRGIADGERKAEGAAARFTQIGGRMRDVGGQLSLAVTLPLVAFGSMAVNAASDAAELQSAFDQTFGAMAADMTEWATETGDAMGRSTQELQRAATMFGIFFNQAAPTREAAAGLSRDFTVLAQDLSSFYNVDPGTAMEKLRAGLSGESEPLRDFGVFLTEATVNARGLQMGLGGLTGELSEQEKILARANLIMEATANAQGDVARTADGTANQVRAAQAAWEELQVTIGTRLLPMITPLVTRLAELMGSFGQLSPETQTFIIGALGIAAALGPVMMGIGGLVSGIGAILPALGGMAGALGLAGGAGGVAAGGMAGFLGVLGPVGLAIGAVVAAWALFGEKIGPVLSQLAARAQEVLGPRLMALFEAVKSALTDLWTGPFGSMIRTVIGFLGDLQAAYLSALGEGLIRVIGTLLSVVTGTFTMIGDALRVVAALLRGDFSGAWTAIQTLISNAMASSRQAIEALAPGAVAAMQRLYAGVRDWLQQRLGAIFNWVVERVGAVGRAFYELYDAVVGHSYVPDMVDGIGRHMARLDAEMVNPARRATGAAAEAFRSMQQQVQGILARLFPEQARYNQFQRDLAALAELHRRNELSAVAHAEAVNRLTREYQGVPQTADWVGDVEVNQGEMPDLRQVVNVDREIDVLMGQWGYGDMPEDARTSWREGVRSALTEGIKALANGDIEGFLEDFFGGIFDRLFDGLLNGVMDMIFGAASGAAGAGGGFDLGGILNSIFAGGFYTGGLIPSGQFGIVGERGPEPVISTPRGALVRPNSSLSSAAFRAPAPSLSMPITIDATGADAAGLARVQASVDRLRAELPTTIIGTVQEATDRRILGGRS